MSAFSSVPALPAVCTRAPLMRTSCASAIAGAEHRCEEDGGDAQRFFIAGNPTTACDGFERSKRTTPSTNTWSASAYTLNGVPFQTTTSAILPGSSVPVWSRMPSDFAGFDVIQRIARSGGMSKPASLPRVMAFAASWFSRWIPSSESECTMAQPPAG